MATGGPRSFTSTPLRLWDGHCVSESGDTLLLVHRTSSRSGRCSRTTRTVGRATVTCAVGWRCVGSEHRVPRFGRVGVHAKLNVLSRFHAHQSWNYPHVFYDIMFFWKDRPQSEGSRDADLGIKLPPICITYGSKNFGDEVGTRVGCGWARQICSQPSSARATCGEEYRLS